MLNCFVTSFPAASRTLAVPSTFDAYVPALVPFADALSPSTVYLCSSTVNSVASKPLTLCSFPSYVALSLFALTVIS